MHRLDYTGRSELRRPRTTTICVPTGTSSFIIFILETATARYQYSSTTIIIPASGARPPVLSARKGRERVHTRTQQYRFSLASTDGRVLQELETRIFLLILVKYHRWARRQYSVARLPSISYCCTLLSTMHKITNYRNLSGPRTTCVISGLGLMLSIAYSGRSSTVMR